ncbi:MAG TPA: hypothetical protein VJY34_16800 [Roseiarcus sp.]|nr:hypothetical protein [Roseiarcus sp.]
MKRDPVLDPRAAPALCGLKLLHPRNLGAGYHSTSLSFFSLEARNQGKLPGEADVIADSGNSLLLRRWRILIPCYISRITFLLLRAVTLEPLEKTDRGKSAHRWTPCGSPGASNFLTRL